MDRVDWLLIFIAAPGPPVDPVRLQKGMFLLAMGGALEPGERYAFEPYLYGPMSRELYRDVRRLEGERLITAQPVPNASWEVLRATAAGAGRASRLRDAAVPKRAATVGAALALRDELGGLSFAALLERVYRMHPEFATRSVFRHP